MADEIFNKNKHFCKTKIQQIVNKLLNYSTQASIELKHADTENGIINKVEGYISLLTEYKVYKRFFCACYNSDKNDYTVVIVTGLPAQLKSEIEKCNCEFPGEINEEEFTCDIPQQIKTNGEHYITAYLKYLNENQIDIQKMIS